MAPLQRTKALVAALVLVPLAGCGDYLNNWDSVTFRAGNAQAANTAIQTARTFPPQAENREIPLGY